VSSEVGNVESWNLNTKLPKRPTFIGIQDGIDLLSESDKRDVGVWLDENNLSRRCLRCTHGRT